MAYSELYKSTVPAGFTVSKIPSEQTISTGLVIYEIPENEVATDSKEKAKTMKTEGSVRSALCSGIQWDMVMKFVDQKIDAKGNLYDARVYYYMRHTGSKANTGKNEYDKVQNIYDLEGNYFEYVAEKIMLVMIVRLLGGREMLVTLIILRQALVLI